MSGNISKAGKVAFTSQTDQTGSRASDGTVYRNLTGGAMLVVITHNISQGQTLQGWTDATATPTALVMELSNQNVLADYSTTCFMVLNGNYYKVYYSGGGNLIKWIEYS